MHWMHYHRRLVGIPARRGHDAGGIMIISTLLTVPRALTRAGRDQTRQAPSIDKMLSAFAPKTGCTLCPNGGVVSLELL